jgi:DNA-binding CsgD family transcriptional regulator
LKDWCESQPGLVAYRGECLAHRAEIFRLRGRWPQALEEAQRAYDALAGPNRFGRGTAAYEMAELHRLRGDSPAAEAAYRLASEHGRSPYPGLALLRLAQGEREAARAAIERVLAETTRGRQRAEVLIAGVEILLASGDVAAAARAAVDLKAISATLDTEWVRAMSAAADGAVHLANGHAREALAPLRDALAAWRNLDAPYEAARVMVLVGRACHALGDADGAAIEWDTAAGAFQLFGAAPALAQLDSHRPHRSTAVHQKAGGLTARELEVLRLIARGKTNRAIAHDLDISEKTVARHISNMFTKLDLSSRAAATAYAFTHGLAH